MIISRKKILITFLFVLSLLFIVLIANIISSDDKNPIYKISYISRNESVGELSFISQGIEQAEKDLNVKVNICTLPKGNKIENQVKLLEKEIKNEVDAIIISPMDYKEISKVIEEANKKIPIVLIDSKIESDKNIPFISANSYEIGKSLALEIIKKGNTRKTIGIVEEEVRCSSLDEIRNGFLDEIKYSKNKCEYVRFSNNKEKNYEEIKKYILDKNVDALVAFDAAMLENIARAKKELLEEGNEKGNVEIYGVGRTEKILSYVENEIIDAVIVKNEFNLGYLSVEMAVNEIMNKKVQEKQVDFSLINKRNMYSEKNQKLIFPFIK